MGTRAAKLAWIADVEPPAQVDDTEALRLLTNGNTPKPNFNVDGRGPPAKGSTKTSIT